MAGTDALDRYLADNGDAPLTRESLTIALAAVRADLVGIAAQIKAANEKALAIDAIKPLRQVRTDYIIAAVAACGGNVRTAMRVLKVGQATVYRAINPRRPDPEHPKRGWGGRRTRAPDHE